MNDLNAVDKKEGLNGEPNIIYIKSENDFQVGIVLFFYKLKGVDI